MRYSSFLVFFLTAAPVGAACFVCDEVVELNTETATCFQENFEVLVTALQTAPAGRQSVNLGACEDTDGAARRDGLIEMGDLPLGEKKTLKTVYILDLASAVCLRDLLEEYDGEFDPSHAFDLVELCDGK